MWLIEEHPGSFCWHDLFLIRNIFLCYISIYHITLLGPPDLSKSAHFTKNSDFCFCWFCIDKMRFFGRKVSFKLLLVLEALDQPKLAVWNQNFLRSLDMISERSTSFCKIFNVTHKRQVSRYRFSCTTRVKFRYYYIRCLI